MIVAGFGFRDGAHVDSLRNALELQAIAPDCLATATAKASAAPFAGLARALDFRLSRSLSTHSNNSRFRHIRPHHTPTMAPAALPRPRRWPQQDPAPACWRRG